ncbi:STE3-type pheromone receptor [Ceratobasidium sp. AG-Ba]|nr:STE3-type pheromone receptor [Ceratobasidium sp. AG-Ba]
MSRFFRLMVLAAMDMACGLPLSLYFLISDPLYRDLEKWPSWAVVHEYIHDVGVATHEDLTANYQLWVALGFTRWCIPGCAYLFFMFFGLSAEAARQYKRIFWRCMAPFGLRPPPPKPKAPTVSWTKRLISRNTNTVQDEITVPSPSYSFQSRIVPSNDVDDKKDIEAGTYPAVGPETNDLEYGAGYGVTKEQRNT